MENEYTPVPHLHRTVLAISEHRRYACLALGQLAMASENHEEMLTAGGLEALSASLDVDNDETIFNACYALNKFASTEENSEVMI